MYNLLIQFSAQLLIIIKLSERQMHSDTSQNRVGSRAQHGQQEMQKRSIQANNLFNKLIAYNYNSKFAQGDQIQDDITKFFDLLIWAQKNCPQLAYQLFDMMAIEQIQQLHIKKCVGTFFRNYIILLGNCKEGGLLAQLLLQHKLPHAMLEVYIKSASQLKQKQQMVEYVGSFLKTYQRIFKPDWLHLFIIGEGYFELLQVSFKFFTCPEPLTKTTVFNIVLALLRFKEVQQFVMHNQKRISFYESMAQLMTEVIRNQLIQFGQRIEQLNIKSSINQVMSEIEDKIALWEDMSLTCSQMTQIFQLPFSNNVLLPLLIGPLKYSNKPLFTLKFSLFMLTKLLKIIANFGLLQIFIKIIFIENNLYFCSQKLNRSIIPQFLISQILNKQISNKQQEAAKQDFGSGIRKFYEGVFRSKDNHFILMSTTFINNLFQNLKIMPQYMKQYGLCPRGQLNTQICQKLIHQLLETHRLITIQAILNSIIFINQMKPLQSDLQTQFVYIFKKVIEQFKITLKSKNQFWDYIVEIDEYDLLKVNKIQFGDLNDAKKFQQTFKVVFMWDIKQQESSYFSFYSSIPDSVEDNFRYLYAKFLMCRKASSFILEGPQQNNLISDYYSKLITICPYNPGDVYKIFNLKAEFYQCQIIEGKLVIPAIWIVDENFFVLGHFDKEKKQIRIIMGIKYKHITLQLTPKKQKILLTVSVRSFDFKSQRLKYKNSIVVKGIQNLMMKVISYQIKIRQKQMIFISNAIKKTQEALPVPSLI